MAKAAMPTSAPEPASRGGSHPRASARAASARPISVPSADSAVSTVVAPTDKAEDLAAIGFEQNVLHAEAGGAEADRDQQPAGAGLGGEARPVVREILVVAARARCRRDAGFLLPQRDDVEDDRHDRGALR